MDAESAMRQIETQLAHVWMVRAFLKHSDEAEGDEDLADVHRTLYDFQLAVGGAWKEQNAAEYLKLAAKKFSKVLSQVKVTRFFQLEQKMDAVQNLKLARQIPLIQ